MKSAVLLLSVLALVVACGGVSLEGRRQRAAEEAAFPASEGWRRLGLADFVNVNGDEDTWREEGGVIHCTGVPIGGARSVQTYTDFELSLEWRHQTEAGNSGVFLWCPPSAFEDLPPGQLPRSGIEVQVLDLAYETNWLRDRGSRSDWFTSHGDVFPVGDSDMTAARPSMTYTEGGETWAVGNPDSRRSFPAERNTKPAGEWNHYRILARGGEVTLWVNGLQVNRATRCDPATGYLALEAEGAPVSFRRLWIRELD